jgi:hypothetical protein
MIGGLYGKKFLQMHWSETLGSCAQVAAHCHKQIAGSVRKTQCAAWQLDILKLLTVVTATITKLLFKHLTTAEQGQLRPYL